MHTVYVHARRNFDEEDDESGVFSFLHGNQKKSSENEVRVPVQTQKSLFGVG